MILLKDYLREKVNKFLWSTPGKKGLTYDPTNRFYYLTGDISWLSDNPNTYVLEGYNKNAAVFSITQYIAKKFGQIPFRVYKVQKGKEKELQQYQFLTKRVKGLNKDAVSLRKKALDDAIVENECDALLQKPTRYLGQDAWLEQLYGFKKLTGEGNLWLNNGGSEDDYAPPVELLIIPKSNLLLIADPTDLWGINGFKIVLGATHIPVIKDNILMWKAPMYEALDENSRAHLRGQSPLKSLLLSLQASNAAAKRAVMLNENAGANGILIDKTERSHLKTPDQLDKTSDTIHNRVNGVSKTGSVTTLGGDFKYIQLGMSAADLKILEMTKLTTRELCAGLGLPPEIIEPDATHTNKKEAKRNWIYDTIAPDAYSLRDELNRVLLNRFGLSRDQYFIDCDITCLPDLSEDMKNQVDAVKDAWWLTPNERRVFMNYEEVKDENMDKIYIDGTPIDQVNAEIGRNLDDEEKYLSRA